LAGERHKSKWGYLRGRGGANGMRSPRDFGQVYMHITGFPIVWIFSIYRERYAILPDDDITNPANLYRWLLQRKIKIEEKG
jgi:hypothetical protein